MGAGPNPPGVDRIAGLPRQLSVTEENLIQADNRFAFKLFRNINQQQADENVFISPLSVAMVLGMTYNGAAGSTREAMGEALELNGMTAQEVNESYRSLIDLLGNLDPAVEFLLANSIWYRNTMTLEPTFIDLSRQFFDAEVSALDFNSPNAAGTINGWVNDKTNGRIQQIVPSQIPGNVLVYLLNAIYFQSNWTYQFDADLTRAAPFTLRDGASISVDMMSHETSIAARSYWDTDFQLVELPYGGEAFLMTVLVPSEPEGIETLANAVTPANWSSWLGELNDPELRVSLPKFTLEYELVMNDVLTALGMGEAFTPAADFTGMYGPGGIWIGEVRHKAFVDVDEEGTEAAAVTSVVMIDSAPPTIVVDRPFLFFIWEKYSGSILFMGKVMDPTAG
jgi:serpin B